MKRQENTKSQQLFNETTFSTEMHTSSIINFNNETDEFIINICDIKESPNRNCLVLDFVEEEIQRKSQEHLQRKSTNETVQKEGSGLFCKKQPNSKSIRFTRKTQSREKSTSRHKQKKSLQADQLSKSSALYYPIQSQALKVEKRCSDSESSTIIHHRYHKVQKKNEDLLEKSYCFSINDESLEKMAEQKIIPHVNKEFQMMRPQSQHLPSSDQKCQHTALRLMLKQINKAQKRFFAKELFFTLKITQFAHKMNYIIKMKQFLALESGFNSFKKRSCLLQKLKGSSQICSVLIKKCIVGQVQAFSRIQLSDRKRASKYSVVLAIQIRKVLKRTLKQLLEKSFQKIQIQSFLPKNKSSNFFDLEHQPEKDYRAQKHFDQNMISEQVPPGYQDRIERQFNFKISSPKVKPPSKTPPKVTRIIHHKLSPGCYLAAKQSHK